MAEPRGPYAVAAIDPPWTWSARSAKGEGRSPRYPRMTIAEIASLPVRDLLAPDAVVLLWVTDPLLPRALDVVRTWGLTYKTVGFCWTKRMPSGAEHLGGGYYTRANPEQCWVLTRGKGVSRADRAVRRLLAAPVRAHSEKPDQFYSEVERLFGNVRRVDVFARRKRDGWDALGDEIDGRDIHDAIRQAVPGATPWFGRILPAVHFPATVRVASLPVTGP
ncbi:DNA methyltransferase [Chloroflexota bacterium]|nr:DNA methyltransferase [Chloroflexota bacterium]